MKRSFQTTAPHYCAGLEVTNQIVTKAAPIIGWAVGKTWDEVHSYFRKKQFIIKQTQ